MVVASSISLSHSPPSLTSRLKPNLHLNSLSIHSPPTIFRNHKKLPILWRIPAIPNTSFLISEAAATPVEIDTTTAAAGTEQLVTTPPDASSIVVSVLVFVAFVGLSVLTIGVIYIGVTEFLQKREKERFEKEEEERTAKNNLGERFGQKRPPSRGFGPKFGQKKTDKNPNAKPKPKPKPKPKAEAKPKPKAQPKSKSKSKPKPKR